jgi:hypothetical protein
MCVPFIKPPFLLLVYVFLIHSFSYTLLTCLLKNQLGACGRINLGSDFIAALPVDKYGTGDRCFKNVAVHCKSPSILSFAPGAKSKY